MVRTRIAPSPTGYPHIGTIYQALFDYVFAKKYDGQFIVRIEDTDRTRFVEGAEAVIFQALDWFGLIPDEDPLKGGVYGPYRSSERLDLYKKYAEILVENGHAYYCFCTKERLDQVRKDQEKKKVPSKYDRHCRNLTEVEIQENFENKTPFVIRMKVPEDRTIIVKDALAGEVSFDSNLIDDQVLLKSDGFPTYHLAVVVDDTLMKITHVFRGKEWLPSAPKHLLLYEFLGWEDKIPVFIHLPLLLSSERPGKLSKRFGHASVDFYKHEGYLPEAILNYLSNIIWNHPEGKEIYGLKDFEKAFDINKPNIVDIASQGPKFDLKKLEWMNGEYIRAMSDEQLANRLHEFLVDHPAKDRIAAVVPLIKERIKKLSDFVPLTLPLFQEPEYDKTVFDRIKVEAKIDVLDKVVEKLQSLTSPWGQEEFETTFRELAQGIKISNVDMFQLIRVAVFGQLVTPPLLESIEFVGEAESIKRIKKAQEFLGK